VNFPFLDGDIPLNPSYGVYTSQLVRFARVCNNVLDFNERNTFITEKLLHQGYRYHRLVKTFTKFYYKYRDLISKYNVTCNNLVKNGISHPDFYGNVIYKARKSIHTPLSLVRPMNTLIKKGYNKEVIIKSLKKVFFYVNIDDVLSSLVRN